MHPLRPEEARKSEVMETLAWRRKVITGGLHQLGDRPSRGLTDDSSGWLVKKCEKDLKIREGHLWRGG